MISYNIEPHDITSLTAPMFDACGLECPAMIGAECPKNVQVKTGVWGSCPGWSAKFPSAAAQVVHSWTLDGTQDEQCGDSVMGSAWHALFRTPESERTGNNPMGAGLILTELSSGAIELTVFDSAEELTEVWAKIVREVEPGLCRHCSDELSFKGGQFVSTETGSAHCGTHPTLPDHEPEETD